MKYSVGFLKQGLCSLISLIDFSISSLHMSGGIKII